MRAEGLDEPMFLTGRGAAPTRRATANGRDLVWDEKIPVQRSRAVFCCRLALFAECVSRETSPRWKPGAANPSLDGPQSDDLNGF